MKRLLCILLILSFALVGCSNTNIKNLVDTSNSSSEVENNTSSTNNDDVSSNAQSNTSSEVSDVTPPKPTHSAYYIDGVDVNTMVQYFNDVCFGSEFGDEKNIITKWYSPILFYIEGTPTNQDYLVLNELINFLNGINGFPGVRQVTNKTNANLVINFCSLETLNLYSPELNADGFTNFNFVTATGEIMNGSMYIRTDINQTLRNSVLQEEFYQVLGPTQDTLLRHDSIIYQYGDAPKLSEIDKCIISMLYNAQISYSMNATNVETILRKIYY